MEKEAKEAGLPHLSKQPQRQGILLDNAVANQRSLNRAI